MNRVGRLLICIAGGVALSVTAYGDVAPAPPVAASVSAFHQNTNVMNRIMLMKRRHQMQHRPSGFSQFATPFLPQPGVPQAPQANVSQPHGTTAAAAPNTAAAAVSSSNPYESIVTRNVFGLNPIPPYTPPPPPAGPPPPKITLTGITTILGPTQALFKVNGVVRGNSRPQDESYMLAEGEEQDDVQVTKIDIKKSIVTFMNHGVEQVIPLTDNGVSSSGAPASAPSWPGQNGSRPFPGRRFFRGGGTPGFQPQSFGTQPQSYNNYNNSYNNQSSGYNNQSSGNSFGGTSTENNGLYNPSAQAVNSGLSGEDEAALIAAQHAQLQQQGNPMAAIMPPTPFDKEAGVTPEPGSEPAEAPTTSAAR